MVRPVKTADSPDYRAKICEVAETLFAERGFDGTPIREIAEQAGATKALIYHYYQSKEALYLSLLEKDVSGVVTKLEEIAASDGDPEDKIRTVVQVFLEQYRANPQGFQLVQRAIDDHSPTAHTLAERWFSRAHLAIQTITTQGIEEGIFKPLPPHSIPFVIIGIIIHALRANQLIDRITPGFSGPELLSGLADLVLTLLRTDASASSASSTSSQTRKKKRLRTA
jgi:AcrR family transcriptional regulator